MLLVGRADELIVGDAELLPHRLEVIGERIDERLRRDPLRLRGLFDLLPVLVHADEEVHVVAAQAPIARDRVRADLLVRVAEVWVAVRVVDGGGEEVLAH